MSWPWKVKVIGQNKWHKLKGFYSSYLVLKFGSVSPLRNWDISRNVILQRSWPWKVKVIGQNKWHRQLPWPQKHRSRHQNLRPKCFSSKVITGQKHTFPPVWKGIVSPVKTYCSIYISNYIPSMKRINTQGYYQHETTPEYVFLTLRTNHSWECIWLWY